MKILDKDRIRDVADMERITREINVLKLLDHPNVIKLYEVIGLFFTVTFINYIFEYLPLYFYFFFLDTQRHIYIVTEYSDGGELFV